MTFITSKLDQNKDLDSLKDMVKALYHHQAEFGYADLVTNGENLWWEKTAPTLESFAEIFVIHNPSGEAVGISVCRIKTYPNYLDQKPRGWISEFYIKPDYRNLGLGQSLFESSLAWFKSKHLFSIELNSVFHNEIAEKFWSSKGFKKELLQWNLEI